MFLQNGSESGTRTARRIGRPRFAPAAFTDARMRAIMSVRACHSFVPAFSPHATVRKIVGTVM